jgi:hypothetical protein
MKMRLTNIKLFWHESAMKNIEMELKSKEIAKCWALVKMK